MKKFIKDISLGSINPEKIINDLTFFSYVQHRKEGLTENQLKKSGLWKSYFENDYQIMINN